MLDQTPAVLDHAPSLSEILPLSAPHLSDVLHLQKIVVDALEPERKNVMIPKNREQFHVRMTDWGRMCGIFAEHEGRRDLIAYGILAMPNDSWPVADMILSPKNLPCNPNALGVLQNAVVHPCYRNHGVHPQLVAARIEICFKLNRQHIMSEIAVSNPASLKGLLKLGFNVISADTDPSDGCRLFFVHREAASVQPACSESTIWINPEKEYERTSQLLAHGYKGTSIMRSGKTNGYLLALHPSS
ncbi:MAG TPA: hypothetical protein DCY07_02415 [Rhodospirillaceae bacterium]|nr:hypothetical protein [Rhodospirillaceae bacterium]